MGTSLRTLSLGTRGRERLSARSLEEGMAEYSMPVSQQPLPTRMVLGTWRPHTLGSLVSPGANTVPLLPPVRDSDASFQLESDSREGRPLLQREAWGKEEREDET